MLENAFVVNMLVRFRKSNYIFLLVAHKVADSALGAT
jgi:hypothetical protein